MRRVFIGILLAVLIGASVPYLTSGVHFSKPEPPPASPPQKTEQEKFREYLSTCIVKDGVIYCP